MTTFQDLHNGLTSLEQDYNTLQTQVDNYKNVVADLNSQVANEKAKSSSLQQQLDQAKADLTKVQAAFDAYKQSHPDTTPAPTKRFPGDPGLGKTLVGQSRGPQPVGTGCGLLPGIGGDPTDREKYWGSPVGVCRTYRLWGENQKAADWAARDIAAGRVPYTSMHTDSFKWADIAKGSQDAGLKDLFTKFAAVKGPVLFALDHEPYDNQDKGTPADFGAMNTHVKSMLPPNVALGPILQTFPFDSSQRKSGAENIAAWYPKGSYHFVGLDDYNHKWFYPAPGGTTSWRDAATIFKYFDLVRQQLGDPDVPIAIAETSCHTDPANPGVAAKWIHEMVALAKAKNVFAISWFDSAQNIHDNSSTMWMDWNGDGTSGKERIDAWGAEVKAGAHLS